jgi:uncharacterized protein (TIRG00374 family)
VVRFAPGRAKIVRLLRAPQFWIGLVVSLGALLLAFRGLDWGEVADASGQADYLFLLAAAAIWLLSVYLRALRWGVLFHPVTHLRARALVGAMNVGYSVNNLLPMHVGELARAYFVSEAEGVNTAHALSTIVVDRVLDVLTVVLMLVLLLPFIDVPAWVTVPAVTAGAAFLVLAALLATLSLARRWALGVADWGARLLPTRHRGQLHQSAEWVLEGFGVLSKPTVLARGVAWSFASWGATVLVMFMVQRAFHLDVGFEAAPFITATTSLVMLVPASPGYIGTFELAAIKSLDGVFNVDTNTAASYALVQHAFLYLAPMVVAGVYLWRERRTWQRMRLWGRTRLLTEEPPGSSAP